MNQPTTITMPNNAPAANLEAMIRPLLAQLVARILGPPTPSSTDQYREEPDYQQQQEEEALAVDFAVLELLSHSGAGALHLDTHANKVRADCKRLVNTMFIRSHTRRARALQHMLQVFEARIRQQCSATSAKPKAASKIAATSAAAAAEAPHTQPRTKLEVDTNGADIDQAFAPLRMLLLLSRWNGKTQQRLSAAVAAAHENDEDEASMLAATEAWLAAERARSLRLVQQRIASQSGIEAMWSRAGRLRMVEKWRRHNNKDHKRRSSTNNRRKKRWNSISSSTTTSSSSSSSSSYLRWQQDEADYVEGESEEEEDKQAVDIESSTTLRKHELHGGSGSGKEVYRNGTDGKIVDPTQEEQWRAARLAFPWASQHQQGEGPFASKLLAFLNSCGSVHRISVVGTRGLFDQPLKLAAGVPPGSDLAVRRNDENDNGMMESVPPPVLAANSLEIRYQNWLLQQPSCSVIVTNMATASVCGSECVTEAMLVCASIAALRGVVAVGPYDRAASGSNRRCRISNLYRFANSAASKSRRDGFSSSSSSGSDVLNAECHRVAFHLSEKCKLLHVSSGAVASLCNETFCELATDRICVEAFVSLHRGHGARSGDEEKKLSFGSQCLQSMCMTVLAFYIERLDVALLSFERSMIGEAEDVPSRSCFTLLALYGAVAESAQCLSFVRKVLFETLSFCDSIGESNDGNAVRIGRFLSDMYAAFVQQSMAGSTSTAMVLFEMFQGALHPYLFMLDVWCRRGILRDPYSEFMIRRLENGCFVLVQPGTPSFFCELSEEILHIGVSVTIEKGVGLSGCVSSSNEHVLDIGLCLGDGSGLWKAYLDRMKLFSAMDETGGETDAHDHACREATPTPPRRNYKAELSALPVEPRNHTLSESSNAGRPRFSISHTEGEEDGDDEYALPPLVATVCRSGYNGACVAAWKEDEKPLPVGFCDPSRLMPFGSGDPLEMCLFPSLFALHDDACERLARVLLVEYKLLEAFNAVTDLFLLRNGVLSQRIIHATVHFINDYVLVNTSNTHRESVTAVPMRVAWKSRSGAYQGGLVHFAADVRDAILVCKFQSHLMRFVNVAYDLDSAIRVLRGRKSDVGGPVGAAGGVEWGESNGSRLVDLYDHFHFDIEILWPLNEVITDENLLEYHHIFALLLKLSVAEHALSVALKRQMAERRPSPQQQSTRGGQRRRHDLWLLRADVWHFVKAVSDFVRTHACANAHSTFIQAASAMRTASVAGVRALHASFLSSLAHGTLVFTHTSAAEESLRDILDVALKLCKASVLPKDALVEEDVYAASTLAFVQHSRDVFSSRRKVIVRVLKGLSQHGRYPQLGGLLRTLDFRH